MISKNSRKVSLELLEDINKASAPCCHLGCTHNVLDQSALADIPQPALKKEKEFIIADSEESLSVCEVEQ